MTENAVNKLPAERSSPGGVNFKPGDLINDRYRIISLLGEGGMCVAYKAEDTDSHNLVAIKFLLPDRLANPKDIMRFEREAKTVSQLSHPSIAGVSDFGILGDRQPYLVMEFVEGQTLAEQIETEGQLPIKETVDIFIAVCDALQYAHSKNVLHRDIKPSNIIVNDSPGKPPCVKLLDFGIAKSMQDPELTIQKLTETGEVVGSPFYMSPEQARGAELDCRSDLYSLGCALYEALTGTPPHMGQTPLATILKRETDKPTTMAEASMGRDFPEHLEQIVLKLLQTDPKDRYQNASELRTALAQAKLCTPSSATTTDMTGAEKKGAKPRNFLLPALGAIAGLATITAIVFWLVAANPLRPARPTATTEKPPVSPPIQSEVPEVTSYEARRWFTRAEEYERKDDYAKACTCYQKAIAAYSENPDSATSEHLIEALTKLASCQRTLQWYGSADQSIKRAISVSRDVYGEHSPQYAATLTSLGEHYLEEKSNDVAAGWHLAEPLFKRSISICEEDPGRYINETTELLRTQGHVCRVYDMPNEAVARYKKALLLCLRKPPADLKSRPEVICKLAEIYCKQCRFDQVKPLSDDLLSFYASCSAPQQWQQADYLVEFADNVQGLRYKTKNTLETTKLAQVLYLKAFKLFSGRYGIGDPSIGRLARLCDQIALTYRIEADYNVPDSCRQAELWYRKARQYFEKQLPAAPMRVAQTDLAIGAMLREQRRYQEAEELVRQAFSAYKRLEGEKTLRCAHALFNLGQIRHEQKQYAQAESYYSQGVRICEDIGESRSVAEADGLYALARCKFDRGKFSEALRLLTKARPIYEKQTPYSPHALGTESLIKEIHSKLKTQG